jgi:hypothetical protein
VRPKRSTPSAPKRLGPKPTEIVRPLGPRPTPGSSGVNLGSSLSDRSPSPFVSETAAAAHCCNKARSSSVARSNTAKLRNSGAGVAIPPW